MTVAPTAFPDSAGPAIVICQLTAEECTVLSHQRAQEPRQRRAWRRVQLRLGAGFLIAAAVLILVLHMHSHCSPTVQVVLAGATGVAMAGLASAWVRTSRQRRTRLRQWPAMTITISRHGLTVQDARTANRLEWEDIVPIHTHGHALEFRDHYGNLLAYLPPRLVTDDLRLQVMGLVHAAGLVATADLES